VRRSSPTASQRLPGWPRGQDDAAYATVLARYAIAQSGTAAESAVGVTVRKSCHALPSKNGFRVERSTSRAKTTGDWPRRSSRYRTPVAEQASFRSIFPSGSAPRATVVATRRITAVGSGRPTSPGSFKSRWDASAKFDANCNRSWQAFHGNPPEAPRQPSTRRTSPELCSSRRIVR